MYQKIFKLCLIGWLGVMGLIMAEESVVEDDVLRITHLRLGHQAEPMGIETGQPHFSWQLSADEQGIAQTGYRIVVTEDRAGTPAGLGAPTAEETIVWDSGRVHSAESIQRPYEGPALAADTRYFWRAQVWDTRGNASAWSETAAFYTGLWEDSDWDGAAWIALEEAPEAARLVPGVHVPGDLEPFRVRKIGANALPQFRRTLHVEKVVHYATASIAGLGHHDLFLNGDKVGDHFLDAGWTDYDEYALYVTHDVTHLLQPGENALGVMLGNGFYNIPPERYLKLITSFGYPKLRFRLHITYSDGSTDTVVSDTDWKVTESAITYSSIYGGEDFDASQEEAGWKEVGFEDRHWREPLTVAGPPALRAQTAEPMGIFETLESGVVTEPQPGVWVYDTGQNASAIPRIEVAGPEGATVRITPGELLDDNGLVTQQASGSPHYYDYTLRGEGREFWQPQFTYYGFRYIQVEGAVPSDIENPGGLPVLHTVESLHVRNAVQTVGEFQTSHELFNQIYHLIDWAMRSNLASVLTDCPHREKLGWLEVPHLMGSAFRYNYDMATFYRKVIDDMQAAQLPNGLVPDIAPEYVEFDGGFRDSPEWGSAAVILPWYLYQWYGDTDVLADSYAMMGRYVDYLESSAEGHIVKHGLGDWFDLGPEPPGVSQLTPMGVTGTAMYYYNLTILAQVAELLDKADDAAAFRERAEVVRNAFNDTFFDRDNMQYATGSQTADAMALYMGLVPEEHREALFAAFVDRIRDHDYQLTGGDIGFRYVLRALEAGGASDTIHRMNNRDDVPGYGYQLARGATALTESWAALRFVSNNHCMLGHLMEWFYSGLGGIRQTPGVTAFREFELRPELVGDIAETTVRYASPYGNILSAWKQSEGRFTYQVEVPVGTMAVVYLPWEEGMEALEGGAPLEEVAGVEVLGTEEDRLRVQVVSGDYHFEVSRNNTEKID